MYLIILDIILTIVCRISTINLTFQFERCRGNVWNSGFLPHLRMKEHYPRTV